MSHLTMPPAKFLLGLGILGRLLQREQPVTALRKALETNGYTSNEISLLFDALRHQRIRGLPEVHLSRRGGVIYWSLVGEYHD